MSEFINNLQKKLDSNTINPNDLTNDQRLIIDELIRRGELKGPTMGQLGEMRQGATEEIVSEKEFLQDPLKAATGVGQPTYELTGDIAGSIFPYVANRKKIFRAAKDGTLLGKGPGFFARSAANVANKLPGRFKFFGSALKGIGRLADPLSRAYRGPLLKTEVQSVLGGTVGAGVGAFTYDTLNEQAGVEIASALADDLSEIPEGDVERDQLTNTAVAMKNAMLWNTGASLLSPFLFSPLSKGIRSLFGTVGPKQKELAQFARDKGLPLPLLSGLKEGQGPFAGLGRNFFRFMGVFPLVAPVGKVAKSEAEIAGGKRYLSDLQAYSPLLKVSAINSSVRKQAEKVFIENVDLYNSAYKTFDNLAATSGNPRIIKLEKTQKAAREFLEENVQQFPEFEQYLQGFGDLNKLDIEKVLTMQGDPINLFMKAMIGVRDGLITPKQFKGIGTMLNNAIEGSRYSTLKNNMFIMREAMETDFAKFGEDIYNPGKYLEDEGIKATYDAIAEQSGKPLADQYIQQNIKAAEQLKGQLLKANKIFADVQGFYQLSPLVRSLRKFDRNAFTAKSLEGYQGAGTQYRDQFFKDVGREVFENDSVDAVVQFKKLIGAEASREIGAKATQGGKDLFKAVQAKYAFNKFLRAFGSPSDAGAKSVWNFIDEDSSINAGASYLSDTLKVLTRDQKRNLQDFSIENVKRNNGIFDTTELKFGADDFAEFSADKFMASFGIKNSFDEGGRRKIQYMLGDKGAKEFYNFASYMKAIGETKLSDPSQFLARRLTLGGGIAGGLIFGAPGLLASAALLLLSRRAGQILTDPVALRAMNDALLPDETLKLLRGEKIGTGTVKATFLPGRDYYSGRSVQTIVDALKVNGILGKTKAVTESAMKLGLTRKRDALARLINYLGEEDKDIPRVDPNTISEAEIIERLSNLPMSIPEPLFKDNIPQVVEENMFADFSESSGDAQEDNNLVSMINRSVQNSLTVDTEEAERDREEFQSVVGDLQLQNPVAPTPPQNTGQVTSQQVADLFPNDPTAIAAARRRENPNV
tara:strand:- start:6693 stop:9809 length:3117 start_codon:yes stop_codon:yes gene_type:complete